FSMAINYLLQIIQKKMAISY
ncbi:Biotin synthase, partial [Haemophilus influenzae]